MKNVIVIPARYGSTRFPGKPLAPILGKPMVHWVIELAQRAAESVGDTGVIVATDDERIAEAASDYDVTVAMTGTECLNGTHRAFEAVKQLDTTPEVIVNMQGDAPLSPPDFVSKLIETMHNAPEALVGTVATQLSWQELDALRLQKQDSPASGTTVTMDENGRALWFSKQIIPFMRKEDRSTAKSPVFRHVGLYAYRMEGLEKFLSWPESTYERLEGLEQLRFMEHGVPLQVAEVDYAGRPSMSGVDTPEDLTRVESLLRRSGIAA